MNARHGLYALLLMTVNGAVWACDLPPLVAIPAAGNVGEESARLIVAVQRYVEGIRSYTACVKAELAAAGGDAAPESLRNQLTVRNNSAVAEARAVLALFGERVTPAENLYLAEFIVGDGDECIQTSPLESTAVVNDIAVLFIERSGQAYLNVLETSCENLERSAQFEIVRNVAGTGNAGLSRAVRLCAKEFIEPYKFEISSVLHRQCPIGRFFELTEEQTERLMARRDAARPAAGSESEAADAEAEETPARQRSER
jgi:hypothetical protein